MEFFPSWYIFPAAFLLDLIIGDPYVLPHPVRWMGKAIEFFEFPFRKIPFPFVISGALFTVFLVLVTWVSALLLLQAAQWLNPAIRASMEIILIYFCISARSLQSAAMEIHQHLIQNKVKTAREKVALIVGRDVGNYNADGIARATIESVAENLVDGVISPLFFAAIGGAPLVLVYKMVNTLDSMVGYKNERYIHFGKASARLDDVLNYIPARLSIPIIALASHLLSGNGRRTLQTAFTEGANHSSPNAGYPEAAFAGALAVKLNGPNYYNGKLIDKPFIGVGFGQTQLRDIKKACHIMLLASLLWFFIAWGINTSIGAII